MSFSFDLIFCCFFFRLFEDFFFSHYTLLESHMQTFRVKIEKSFYLRKNFTDVVLKVCMLLFYVK